MSEQNTAPANPFPFMPGFELWQRSMHDGFERMKSLQEEYAKVEEAGLGQMRSNLAEGARMMTETMHYTARLNSEWRKLTLEATKRAVEMFTPPAAR